MGSGLTYLPTRQGRIYLSLVTNAFSQRIVGPHIHPSLHTAGCLAALDRTVRRASRAATGCVHHSDRSNQYTSDAYRVALGKAQLRCPITDGHDCDQNALVERVSGILKDEFLFVLPAAVTQARLLVDQAIHLCNEEHPCLTMNYLTFNKSHQQGRSPAEKSERNPCLIPVNK